MNAIILAGGFGSRLRPLTDNCPKPMLPIANRPMLDFVVSQLNYYGIRDLVFTLGYMPEKVKNHAEKYEGIRCRFSLEDIPLGTAGGVKKAQDMLDDLFFVMSGDALSNINLGAMARAHFDSGNEVTIATVTVDDPTRYGVVQTDSNSKVEKLIEKPSSNRFGREVSTGIYIINKSVLSFLPTNVPFDFAKDLFPSLIETGKVGVYRHDGYWCDIGDKKSYYNANFYMSEESFYPFVRTNGSATSEIKMSNLISSTAITVGKIRQSIIGNNAKITSSAVLDGCIVMDGVTVKGRYKDCIIGDGFCEKMKSFDKIGQESTPSFNKISLIER